MSFFHFFLIIVCIISCQANPLDSNDDDYYKNLEMPHPGANRFEGDILLPENIMAKTDAIRFDKYGGSKWPSHEVPYFISPLFSSSQKRVIDDSIASFNNQVRCIKFRPASPEKTDLVFIFPGKGCYSNVGRQGGMQNISLSKNGCIYKGAILHEMLHTVGIAHENNRADRDGYIEILWDNIPEKLQSQYTKTDAADFNIVGPYDYYSIMHYPVNVPGTSKPAFTVKTNGIDKNRIGNGNDLTRADIDGINKLYC